MKVSVTLRAVIQRINRKLSKDYKKLEKSRSINMKNNCGEYYILDTYRNTVIETQTNIEYLARNLGVLGAHEEIIG